MPHLTPMPFVPPGPRDERWADIDGFTGKYWISTHGRVFARTRSFIGLKKTYVNNTYLRVTLTAPNSKIVTHDIHVLIAKAFLGPPLPGQIALHNDGNPTNSVLSNIRWGTYSDNAKDRVKHGNNENANKTECKYGHPFTPENTTYDRGPNGERWRVCVACRRRRNAAGWQRRKARREGR